MLVPLCFEKSMWTTIAMLGVLKAGAGFVLLDCSLPERRLQATIQQINPKLVLSSLSNQSLCSRLAQEVFTVSQSTVTDLGDRNSRLHCPSPLSTMYIVFTSGSTGIPKGVVISHGNFASALHHQSRQLGFNSETRTFDFTSYAFDVSIATTFTTLFAGGCFCVPRDQDRMDKLAESITSLRANVIFLTPSVARLLDPRDTPTLRTILLGGEAVSVEDANRWWDKVRVVNIYGPCECTPYSTINCCADTPEGATRIGRGSGLVTWVVDPENHETLLRPGRTGELLLEGPLVGIGYFQDLEKSTAAFVDDPPWLRKGSSGHSGRNGRLYRTGDLVQYNGDGSLTFMGRKDSQVKIRGQRVELAEVEYYVRGCMPGVRQVVVEVIVPQGEESRPLLAAFLQMNGDVTWPDQQHSDVTWPDQQHSDVTWPDQQHSDVVNALPILSQVEESLANDLPRYMLPMVFFFMRKVPLTATGKVNRIRLREIGGSYYAQQLAELCNAQSLGRQPTSQAERQMQQIWATVLAVEATTIGLDDSFFKLGGDSIAAMKVVAEARRKLAIKLTVADVFSHPTLAEITSQRLPLANNTPKSIPPFALLGRELSMTLLRDISIQYQLDPATIEDVYPCTPLQEGLMSLSLQQPGEYITQRTLELSPSTAIPAFCSAWEETVRKLAILRTRVVQHNIGPLQVVLDETLRWNEATGLDEYLRTDRKHPMEMGQPLSRYALIKDDSGKHKWFVWTLHHALYDGWSLSLIVDVVNQVYRGDLAKTLPDFKAFIKCVMEQSNEKMADYWRKLLEGCDSIPFPAPPASVIRPEADSIIAHRLECPLRLSTDITMSTLIRASWALIVGRMANSDDIVFGVTVSGRSAPVIGIEEIAGPTIATVPFRVRLMRDQLVSKYLETLQRQSTEMIAFEQIGLHRIAKLCPDGQRACQFQTLLIIQPPENKATNQPFGKWQGSGQQEWINTYPLVLEMQLDANSIMAKAVFDSRAIKPWMVQSLLEKLGFAMQQVNNSLPKHTIDNIGIVTQKDLEQIWNWNSTVPAPVERCVHELIEERVLDQPNAPAICAWDGELSYGELNQLAVGLARRLIEKGIMPDMLVPLCFEKSMWTTVAILGLLKAGAGFVLLDPSIPEQRLRSMSQQTGSRILLSSFANMALSSRLSEAVIQVGPDGTAFNHTTSPLPQPQPSSTMYAVFTSGSTGAPKGVLISHTNFCSALKSQLQHLSLTKDSRVLDFASYAFDVAIHNAIATLVVGGCLCVPSDSDRKGNISEMMRAMRPTIANLTPTVARLLDPTMLRTVILLGEAVTISDAKRWWCKAQLINTYGPAECTPISTINTAASSLNEATRIGKGAGLVTWVVDQENYQNLLPPGCVGELLLEGPPVGRGYLNEPEKTAAVFIEDPVWLLRGFLHLSGRRGRLYKTGDLVQYNEDGSLTFVGRKDNQVKIRGQRVELGEIEHRVQECITDARQVAAEVIIPQSENAGPALIAFVEMDDSASKTNMLEPSVKEVPMTADIRVKLCEYLPSYMVPTVILSLPMLPTTTSGKTNRRRLREVGRSFLMVESQRILQEPEKLLDDVSNRKLILQTEWPAYTLAQEVTTIGSLSGWDLAHGTGPQREDRGFVDLLLHSAGLDSVSMMSFVYFIAQKFHVQVSMKLLMNETTSIRTVARVILDAQFSATTKSEGNSSTSIPASVNLMAEINRHDSRIAIAQQGSQARDGAGLESTGVEWKPVGNKRFTIFLTGANGFIGTQVLRQLLEHRLVDRVVALVRGKTTDTARNRTIAAAKKALWWADIHEEKLQVWKGDLSLPHLGLDPIQWSELEGGEIANVVIHNGALVHWGKPYSALEAVNVGSTLELLQLAVTLPRMRFVYITAGLQWVSQDVNEEDVAKKLSTADAIEYSQTKFVAEAIVRRAALRCASGMNHLAVVRPGFVIGTPTEGVADDDDYIWRLAATCIRVGAYNADTVDTWLPLSDSTTTAMSIVDAALATGKSNDVVTHVRDGITRGGFWAVLRAVGYQLEPKDTEGWLTAVREDIAVSRETHPLWPLAHMLESLVMQESERWVANWREACGPSLRLKLAIRRSAEYLMKAGCLPQPSWVATTTATAAMTTTGTVMP